MGRLATLIAAKASNADNVTASIDDLPSVSVMEAILPRRFLRCFADNAIEIVPVSEHHMAS